MNNASPRSPAEQLSRFLEDLIQALLARTGWFLPMWLIAPLLKELRGIGQAFALLAAHIAECQAAAAAAAAAAEQAPAPAARQAAATSRLGAQGSRAARKSAPAVRQGADGARRPGPAAPQRKLPPATGRRSGRQVARRAHVPAASFHASASGQTFSGLGKAGALARPYCYIFVIFIRSLPALSHVGECL